MSKTGSRQVNPLSGPLIAGILKFSIPLLLSNLLQVFYSAADMIVVTLSGVEGAIGAIGTTSSLLNLVLNLFAGFATGTSVVVANNIGKGDRENTGRAVHTSLLVALFSGCICAAVGILIARPALAAMGDEGHILTLASTYMRIYCLGTPFLALTNFMISILRAKGDTTTSLRIMSIAGILNVVLNLVFVLCFGMSVDGVALATAISNVASAAMLLRALMRDTGWCRVSLRELRWDGALAKKIVYNGIPAALQGMLFNVSNIMIQSSIIGVNNLTYPGGSAIIDGNSAGLNLEHFVYTGITAVTQAAVTFVSQHHGARKYRRCKRVMADCLLTGFVLTSVWALTVYFLRVPLLGIYVKDPAAIEAGSVRLTYMFIPYGLCAVMDISSSVLRGLNRPVIATVSTLAGCCALRILWLIFVLPYYNTLACIFIIYPISWLITATVQIIIAGRILGRYSREYPEPAL